MKEKICLIVFVFVGFIFFQCTQTNEPGGKNEPAFGITETNAEGNFSGAIDLNDWDPSSYQHLSLQQEYWISVAFAETVFIPSWGTSLRLHNLSQSSLPVKASISLPFSCSIDSISVESKQTSVISLGIDTNLIGQDTLILGIVTFTIGSNDPISYTVGWEKPQTVIGPVVVRIDPNDRLFPAYPNPANGSIAINFSSKKNQHVLLYVLNAELQPVDTLINDMKQAGTHRYSWLTTAEERSEFPPGIYRIAHQTESYSRFGDIEIRQ